MSQSWCHPLAYAFCSVKFGDSNRDFKLYMCVVKIPDLLVQIALNPLPYKFLFWKQIWPVSDCELPKVERRSRQEKATIFNSLFMVCKASGLRVNSSAPALAGKRVCLYREVNALKKDQKDLERTPGWPACTVAYSIHGRRNTRLQSRWSNEDWAFPPHLSSGRASFFWEDDGCKQAFRVSRRRRGASGCRRCTAPSSGSCSLKRISL